jgi:hypothetical protein
MAIHLPTISWAILFTPFISSCLSICYVHNISLCNIYHLTMRESDRRAQIGFEDEMKMNNRTYCLVQLRSDRRYIQLETGSIDQHVVVLFHWAERTLTILAIGHLTTIVSHLHHLEVRAPGRLTEPGTITNSASELKLMLPHKFGNGVLGGRV